MSRSVRFTLYIYPVLIIISIIMMTPLIWMVVTAFKSTGQVLNMRAPLLPIHWHWGNLLRAWREAPFGRFYLNSIVFSVTATCGQIATSAMAGYAFAKLKFPGRQILFYVVLAGLMIPFAVIMLPVVQIVGSLHWLNTYQGLIVPNVASAFGMFLFRQYFLTLPRELDDAAIIDGCSRFQLFYRVNLPMVQPVVASFGILSFLTNWNNFLYPLIVTNKTSMMVLPLGLSIFQSQYSTQYNLMMAAALIAIAPIFVVSIFAQRRVVDGITLGAIK
jgi:multiple sugar transport system permease protein